MNKKTLIFILLVIILLQSVIFPVISGIKIESETFEESIIQGKVIDLEPLDDLPSYFDWRSAALDENGHGIHGDTDFSTSVKSQVKLPSCETFALLSSLEALVQIEVGYPFGCDLSEAHLFFFSGGVIDWGSYPENDTKFLKEYGVPDEDCWPYPREYYQFPLNTTSPDWQKRTVKITDWYYLPEDIDIIKTAIITNGPVPTYFLVYEDFYDYKKGIYQHRRGSAVGPHYVCLMGWNDDPGYWIVKNSWGTRLQDEGWFNIRYGECGIEKKSFFLEGVYGQFPIAYVDDNNIEGPWNGSKEFPYQTIQKAIDEVYPGYTIYVMNGTYNENLIVNKSIKIDGEDKFYTIIDGGGTGDVITISEYPVRISGFTVQNSGSSLFDAGIKTLTLKSSATIRNNIIQNNDIGLFLNYAYDDSEGSIIQNNIIQNNREGIYAHWINFNEIIDNTIRMNKKVGLEMQSCKETRISNNIISNNGEYGIYLRGASEKNIINGKNTIRNNSIGLIIEESNQNQISNNNFINNSQQAYIYNSFLTRWKNNFWDNWQKVLPKIIRGHIGHKMMPYFNVDWFPKRNSYL
jgi:parallel beta-helix repeat protein